jgi:hypothetical protein
MEVLAKQLQHTYRHCFRRNRSSKPAASSPAAQVSSPLSGDWVSTSVKFFAAPRLIRGLVVSYNLVLHCDSSIVREVAIAMMEDVRIGAGSLS